MLHSCQFNDGSTNIFHSFLIFFWVFTVFFLTAPSHTLIKRKQRCFTDAHQGDPTYVFDRQTQIVSFSFAISKNCLCRRIFCTLTHLNLSTPPSFSSDTSLLLSTPTYLQMCVFLCSICYWFAKNVFLK